jgi:Ca2+-binding RTX toxin-like protein
MRSRTALTALIAGATIVTTAGLLSAPAQAAPAATVTCFGTWDTDDVIFAEPGPPTTYGTLGTDVIIGSPGKDKIEGLAGNDRICGMAGDDTISGGTDSSSGTDSLAPSAACETVRNVP